MKVFMEVDNQNFTDLTTRQSNTTVRQLIF